MAAAKKKPTAAAKKPTRTRTVAKVSPSKGMDLDAWIAAKAANHAGLVRKVIDLVKSAAPDATVSIKWGQPVFDLNGPFVWVRAAKAHVTLGFWRGRELKDTKGLLEGEGDRMAHVKLASEAAMDRKTLEAFVREAARLNREKGDPTKRS